VLGQVADDQVPQAIGMGPDLVSLAAGGNDLLRFRSDPDALAQLFDDMVRTLLMAGSQVLIFTGFDPRFPVLRLIRGKVAAYNMHLRAIADRHGCDVVHLTPDGHRRVALRACEVAGVDVAEDWREPWPTLDSPSASGRAAWLAARRMDLRWGRDHAAPWVARRVRGISSGDNIDPKRPELLPL